MQDEGPQSRDIGTSENGTVSRMEDCDGLPGKRVHHSSQSHLKKFYHTQRARRILGAKEAWRVRFFVGAQVGKSTLGKQRPAGRTSIPGLTL